MFENKKVLVTAGPTWTAVDRVRVITSIFSGETGLRFARHFKDLGAQVTLLMGPGRAKFLTEDWTAMNIKQFFYYDDLADMLEEELEQNHFDIIIHSSAVSDYKTANAGSGKIPSGKNLSLDFEPTAKLVDRIHTASPDSFLVKFKLQVGLTPEELFEIAFNSLKSTGADLIVANDLDTMDGENHLAYIIDPQGSSRKVATKDSMCRGLEEEIRKRLE
jgi:phosphopantothenoylcysteine decarboxylase/phosphopantothenate--cysteine ligase